MSWRAHRDYVRRLRDWRAGSAARPGRDAGEGSAHFSRRPSSAAQREAARRRFEEAEARADAPVPEDWKPEE